MGSYGGSYEPFASLGVAAAAGLLIGLERERAGVARGKGELFGGARTHPLVALVGGLSVLVGREVGWAAPVAAFAALSTLLVVSYAADLRAGGGHGVTSEAALLLSFLLGALALTREVVEPTSRRALVVAAVAVVATFLLSAKPRARAFAERLSPDDVAATLKFLVVAVVVLPLLPDEPFGPYEVLNPREIGLLLVLIAGISFVGYAAVRLLGPERGLGLTGVVGGLASSTAVTLSMSARAREEPGLARACALAAVLASTIMVARVAIVVGVISRPLLAALAAPLGAMAAASLAACLVLFLRSRRGRGKGPVRVSNPFELATAAKFALLYSAVLLGSKAASEHLGAAGTYLAGVLAGATDVDAISLSMARLAGEGGVDLRVAATTVVLGVASNTAVKGGIAAALGGGAYARAVAVAFAGTLLAGGIALALT